MYLKTSTLLSPIVCLFAFCCTTAFGQKIIPVDSAHVQILRIDPSNAYGGKMSDFFAEIEYIPLETTNESLFGSILRLEMTDDRYYIVESQSRYLLIFDRKGKFIKKLGSESEPGMHMFDFNKFTKQLILRGNSGKTRLYYDLDGNFIKKETTNLLNEKTKINGQLNYLTADKGIDNNQTYKEKDTTSQYYKRFQGSLIVYANADHKFYATGLQFPETQTGLDVSYMGLAKDLTPGTTDTVYYYSRPYDYEIYSISLNKIQLSYKFVFPLSSAVPPGFSNDTTLRGKRWEWFDTRRDVIQSIVNFYRLGNNLTFTARSRLVNDEDMLIYNLKSGSLIAYKHITRDPTNSFLPIFEDRAAYKSGGILTAYKNDLYASLSSLEMFNAYEENKERKQRYPAHLNQYFTTRNKKDNPVLIRLKLKDEI